MRHLKPHEWIRCGAVALLLGAALLSGCGAGQRVKEGPRGTVRFKGEPEDAQLSVDETRLGPVGMFKESGVKLKPGSHRIVVRKDGYFPEYRIIEVTKGSLTIVEVALREIP